MASPDERGADLRVSLARIRHDMLTPVNAIIGYGELLLEDAEDEGADAEIIAALATVIEAGREALSRVTEQLGEQASEALTSPPEWRLRGDALRRMLEGPSAAVLTSCAALFDHSAQADPLRADVEKIESAVGTLAALVEQTFAPASTLPLRAVKPAPAERLRESPERAIEPADAEARGNLLVVDDTATNRDVLARRLQREGFAVRTAEDGERALAMLRSEDFDLVLLDIVMPVMDGYEVLSTLKADPDLRDIPVIMISALDEIESVARCIEMGAEDYLPKSFNATLLRARIHASLARKFFRDRERAYLHSVEQLTEAATAVAQEVYEHDDSLTQVATRDDGLGHLARVFQTMVRDVYQRERRLKQQVRELRLEVDKVRRDSEVEEITSTDYFKHLKNRALELRRRG